MEFMYTIIVSILHNRRYMDMQTGFFDWLSEGLGLEVQLEVTYIAYLSDHGFFSYIDLLF